MPIIRDVTIDAVSGPGRVVLDTGTFSAEPFELENAKVHLAVGEFTVSKGRIVAGGDGGPRLVVDSGQWLDGATIHAKEFELPSAFDMSGGMVVVSTPASAFPEGQSRAREVPRWLSHVLYGKVG